MGAVKVTTADATPETGCACESLRYFHAVYEPAGDPTGASTSQSPGWAGPLVRDTVIVASPAAVMPAPAAPPLSAIAAAAAVIVPLLATSVNVSFLNSRTSYAPGVAG